MKNYFRILSLSLFLLVFVMSCASTTENSVDEGEINQLAARSYSEMKAKSKLSKNPEWTALVNRVAQRIARASGENFAWEVMLIDSPEVNAWCMPGGKMAVYTGILPVLKTEGALAAVMGHEVAHATLRHGMQRYARAKQNNFWGLIAAGASIVGGEILCKTENCRKMAQLGGLTAGFAITFLDRKFSREDEVGADKRGQIYMARAGYDPVESIRLWERMSAAKGGQQVPEFISTHPSDTRRRGNLNEWMSEAQAVYAEAPVKYGVGEAIR
ncbi:MAG: M48 family metallopeptidase [Bdellovibrionales bacterium]